MLQFTYASAHPPVQRTTAIVVVCVVALHVLAIASLLLSPSTTDIDNQQSIAMEMVLAPVSNTPAKAQQQPVATQTAAPKSAATKAEQTTPSSAPASQKAAATPAATPAQTGQAGQTNYSAAKAGMHGFSMALAQELATKGVTVNTVSPGYIGTDMVNAIREDVLAKIVATVPVKRLGQPSEIASIIAWLASEEGGYATGADFSVNGGLHMG
mgnify:CR=1 FL=1